MGSGSGPVQYSAWSVEQSLTRLVRDIGLPVTTVEQARWTASRWSADRRRETEPFPVHQVLARIDDDAERFAAIDNLPGGKTHWILDDARRRVEIQTKMPIPRMRNSPRPTRQPEIGAYRDDARARRARPA
ncbi:DUF6192 family protein [Streptomyces sp. NPDC002698]|uniref:DUF6192 family protein n=1 Tax=Streptomyces sp. NPDC002698 TaxID=3364660 RepID=UPI0036A3B172